MLAKPPLLTLDEVKKLVVIAMFSDNELLERLVLKGGNALDLIHRITTRASLDIDLSMDGNAGIDFKTFRKKIEVSLKETFRLEGYEVFELKMEEKPKTLSPILRIFGVAMASSLN